jgi:hypothetical protein
MIMSISINAGIASDIDPSQIKTPGKVRRLAVVTFATSLSQVHQPIQVARDRPAIILPEFDLAQ